MAVTPPLVVLLGATGFVGSAVLRELTATPVRIRAVSRRPAVVPAGSENRVEVYPADLTAPGAVAEALDGADVVVHALLYSSGATTWRVEDGDTGAERLNVGVARDVVEALRARRAAGAPPVRVLFAGAASQVGAPDKDVLDGTETDRPKGEYDRQKLRAEELLLAADAEGVLRAASLRLPTVFGYGPASTARDKGVVSTMVRRALSGEPLTMWHDGTVRRDLLYVEDAARAFAAALDHVDELAGRHWLLGTGEGRPLGEVFRTVADLAAARTGEPPVPVVSVEPPAHAETGDFRSVTVDSSAFRSVTGWQPATDLDEALRRTVAFQADGGEEALS
ncbi:NAD-dependent epimerase/dehydratase family protein [Streptomyces sp. NPDC058657]|uniref:NAD-dependent epimerase/dehydratase family protein n=1 Tax=unclassified Streptomyces TaxID=2593676 RepID=UPI00364C092B